MITARPSQHYTLILDGAVRKYHDGREICCDNQKGRAEYHRRIAEMAVRQRGICSLSIGPKGTPTHGLVNPTFEHTKPRRMGGAFRDDRIVDENGVWMNSAACYRCNGQKGSQRL